MAFGEYRRLLGVGEEMRRTVLNQLSRSVAKAIDRAPYLDRTSLVISIWRGKFPFIEVWLNEACFSVNEMVII